MLTIEQILAAQDRPTEKVPVPEWGGEVYVRRISAAESIAMSIAARRVAGNAGSDEETATARLAASLAAFLCDADGKPICTLEQAQALTAKSANAVNRIVSAGHRLNATDDREIEALAKNSAPNLDASSPSD